MRNSAIQKKIAVKVRGLLARKKLTAEGLCTEIEYSLPNFYNFLNGKRGLSLETLDRVAKGLGVSLKDLMPD
jgi:transcriptional regulator with XRE-family HTH domain